jgi:hypothetical protein
MANKTDTKLKLIKIFSDTKYEYAFIDDKFIKNFLQLMWKNIFDSCKSAIISGSKQIYVDDFTVSSYGAKYPAHERSNVYQQMLPHIQQELDDSGIPYTTDLYTMNKTKRFRIDIEELKKFSNVERLEILK